MLRVIRVAGRRVALRRSTDSWSISSSFAPSSSSSSLSTIGVVTSHRFLSAFHPTSSVACNHHLLQYQCMTSRSLKTSSCHSCSVRTVDVPQLAESISEGDIRWEKAVGDTVAADEIIGEIETDKTSVAINAPVSGVIEELLVEDGSTVRPGQQVVRIRITADDASSPAAAAPKNISTAKPEVARPSTDTPPATSSFSATAPVPQPPTIPSQPITMTSTSSFAAPTASSPSAAPPGSFGARTEQRVKINRMRARIAQRLKDAQNTYAMLTTFNEIDMTNAIEMRNLHKEAFAKRHNLKLGFMSAFVGASVHALKHQPIVNAVIDENEIVYRDYIDISVAVATPKGLVVPVLRNCENMHFAQIEQNIALLGEKARNNALAIEDMDGGTFTISNGGVFGSLMGTPIINPPQSAILGMHSIVERPVVVNKQIVIRPMMYVALTYDHRLIDGREAVTFLRKIKAAVEDPRVLQLDL